MRTLEAVPIYAKRACPAAKFGTARGALLLITSFFLALIPWSLDCVLADTPELGTPSFSIKALQSQCYAETPNPGTYPEADYSFIEYLANSAGIANQGDLVTSSIGIVAVTTGINMTKATGAQIGAQLSTCLDSLADAADYPAYSELSAAQQASWGSADNYNAAKYNSFLNAFGLGDAAQRYKEGFTGSGGGSDFDFTQQEKDKVDRLGRIANRWISGIGNTVGDLKDFFNNKQAIETWLPQGTGSLIYDGKNQSRWPSRVPTTLYGSLNNIATVNYRVPNNSTNRTMTVQSDSTVTMVLGFLPGSNSTYSQIGIYLFSKNSFGSRLGTSGNYVNSLSSLINNETVYYMWFTQDVNVQSYESNLPGNLFVSTLSQSNIANLGYCILYGNEPSGEAEAEEVEDYPEEPNSNQNTWIPAIGIVPSISWPQLTTPNIPNPSESPYNPDFKTDTPEWNNEAATNLLHLSDIKFDKLFPFCLLFDISLLFNKVQSTISDDGNSYNVLAVPFDYGVDDESMTVDLSWLHDLALMIRPFVQILLAALLLFVTIWFWKGILAG